MKLFKNPGGGSKLIVGEALSAIEVPPIPNVNGQKSRISGIMIQDLLIAGKGDNVGINILQDNDGIRIENVVAINLKTGIIANAADAMLIKSCWISEVKNSIQMIHGIQNIISNCQLVAQPSGITLKLTNQENMLVSGNQIYPDGSVNLQLNCRYVNVSSNNFQSYYVGMIELHNSNKNLITGNVIWMREPSIRLLPDLFHEKLLWIGSTDLANNFFLRDFNKSLVNRNPHTNRRFTVFKQLVLFDEEQNIKGFSFHFYIVF